jgi:hypothetical protein
VSQFSDSFFCRLQALFVIGSAKVRGFFYFPNLKGKISMFFFSRFKAFYFLLKRAAKVRQSLFFLQEV